MSNHISTPMISNSDEVAAYQYLQNLGYLPEQIEYEPNRGKTPDFVLPRGIAIEVSRLNLDKIENLECQLRKMICKAIKKQQINGSHTMSFFVRYAYKRPLQLESKKLHKILREHQDSPEKPTELRLDDNFHLEFIQAYVRKDYPYIFGGYCDLDNGGHLVMNMWSNINRVIARKEQKISDVYKSFSSWWLILSDHISGGEIDEYDLLQLYQTGTFGTVFDKVIIISPSNGQLHFVLETEKRKTLKV